MKTLITHVIKYYDLPKECREELLSYCTENNINVPNGSYIRYPNLFDWEDIEDGETTKLDEWLFSNGIDKKYGFIIIHMDV